MPGITVGRIEPGAALAEIHLASDARLDHPLQRPIDGRPPDSGRLLADEIEEIVGAQVAFLFEKDPEDAIALAGAFAACRT